MMRTAALLYVVTLSGTTAFVAGGMSRSPAGRSAALTAVGAVAPAAADADGGLPAALLRRRSLPRAFERVAHVTGGQGPLTPESNIDADGKPDSFGKGTAVGGTSTVAKSTFNLVKNIVGAGVLSLPAGVAALSPNKGAIVPACAVLVSMGLLSSYCFHLLGRAASASGSDTYGGTWETTVGPKSAWLPKAVCTSKTGVACLAYSMIVADTFATLFQTFGAPAVLHQRNVALWTLTLGTLAPLCLLRSFAALSYTSLLGVLGMIYTTGFTGLRFMQGAYAPGGRFFNDIAPALQPSFGGGGGSPIAAFVLVSMASTAFIAHYNAPKFYGELKEPSVAKFNAVVGLAFGGSIALMVAVMVFGFLTFGANAQGFILGNYALGDNLALAARVAIGIAIICGYPLTFVGFRDGLLELGGLKGLSQPRKDVATLVCLAAITLVAGVVRDLGFVLAFAGATLGSLLAYILPARIALAAGSKGMLPPAGFGPLTPSAATERQIQRGVFGLGFVLMGLGSSVSLLKFFTNVLG